MDGDLLLVGIEAQAVWLWGVRDAEDGPLVFERENAPDAQWTDTGEHLAEFLWHFTLVEAVLACRSGLGVYDVDRERFRNFLTPWSRIPVRPWRWPGPEHAMWHRDGLLAWTAVNDRPDSEVTERSTYSIFVGGRGARDLVQVSDTGIDWDWDSLNDR